MKIIAEIANAHQGNFDEAKYLVEAAAESAADIIKFQPFKYSLISTESYYQYKDYQKLFFTNNQWKELFQLTKDCGCQLAVDLLDEWSLEIIANHHSMIDFIKFTSSVAEEENLCVRALDFKKPVFLNVAGFPTDYVQYLVSRYQRAESDLILSYGYQAFPNPLDQTGLDKARSLQQQFNLPILFADHLSADEHPEPSILIALIAASCGFDYFEKHITRDRSARGYDYYSSLHPDEFARMTLLVKSCSPITGPSNFSDTLEKNYSSLFRKAVARTPIAKGANLTEKHIAFKRTEEVSTTYWQAKKLLGTTSIQNISPNSALTIEKFSSCAKVGTFIQVRCGSSRLPQKALLMLNGLTCIERVILNAKNIRMSDLLAITTSTDPNDQKLAQYAEKNNIPIFYGHPTDIIKRYLDAAEHFKIDHILRATGDCPLISTEVADQLISSHIENNADYTYILGDYIPGINSEVYSVRALKKMASMRDTSLSEYMTIYFKNNPDEFKLNGISIDPVYHEKGIRVTMDEGADHQLLEEIFKRLDVKNEPVEYRKAREVFLRYPELKNINADLKYKWTQGDLARQLEDITRPSSQ